MLGYMPLLHRFCGLIKRLGQPSLPHLTRATGKPEPVEEGGNCKAEHDGKGAGSKSNRQFSACGRSKQLEQRKQGRMRCSLR